MNKLLRVNLKLMVRRKDTRLCAGLSVVLAVLGALVSKLNGNMTWYDMFEFPLILVMIFSAVGGLFISRDYTQNTIRNKLTVGHKRTGIYLANQITETIFFGRRSFADNTHVSDADAFCTGRGIGRREVA